jgi:hypothetical protein
MGLLLMDCSQVHDWPSTLQHRALLYQTSLLLPSMHGTSLFFLSPENHPNTTPGSMGRPNNGHSSRTETPRHHGNPLLPSAL